MTKTKEKNEEATELAPLWPNGAKIPNILLAGEYSTGKTLFGLLLDPEGKTLMIDLEDSGEPYEHQIPFTRKDLPAILADKFKGRARPHQLWSYFLDLVDAIEPGKFRVCLIDPASELEAGLVEYVRRNPREFGLTQNQIDGASSLLWGAVKDEWKRVLLFLASKFETTVITVHMRQVFEGGRPVRGKREPKGKETLSEVASLSLELQRELDENGKRPDLPSAIVRKTRLTVSEMKDGNLKVLPVLPDRLPEATGEAIRGYILKPVGARGTRRNKGETIESEKISEEDRLLIEQEIEEDRARSSEAELKKLQLEAQLKGLEVIDTDPEGVEKENVSPSDESSSGESVKDETKEEAEPPESGKDAPGEPEGSTAPEDSPSVSSSSEETQEDREGLATDEQLERIRELRKALEIDDEDWKEILSKRDVSTARDLWEEQADQLIYKLTQLAESKGKVGELEKWASEVLGKSSE